MKNYKITAPQNVGEYVALCYGTAKIMRTKAAEIRAAVDYVRQATAHTIEEVRAAEINEFCAVASDAAYLLRQLAEHSENEGNMTTALLKLSEHSENETPE